MRSLATLMIALGLAGTARALTFEDRFDSDAHWDLLDMEGDAVVRVVEDPSVPPGYGPAVLSVRATQLIGLAKDARLGDGTIMMLYREMQPRDEDADGLIMFRGQYGEDLSEEHNTKRIRPHLWMELDNDSGLHVTHVDEEGHEEILAQQAGLGLITDPWNITNWIWQKVALQGNTVRAKFWPAQLPEPVEWQLELDRDGPPEGRFGFRAGSGDIHLAYCAADAEDIRIPAPKAYLFTPDARVTQVRRLLLTLFTNTNSAVTRTFELTVSGSGGEAARASLAVDIPSGHGATPIILADEQPSTETGHVVNLPAGMAPGSYHVELASPEGDFNAGRGFELVGADEVRALFAQVREAIEALGSALEGVEGPRTRKAASLQTVHDAALAHCENADGLFDGGDVDAAKRSLRFAVEALDELRGFKGEWLEALAPDAQLPELPVAPAHAGQYETPEDGVRHFYSTAYRLRCGQARADAASFIMGRSYDVSIPWILEGEAPARDFAFRVTLESPYGHRVVAASDTRPETPTSQWEPGEVCWQRFTFDVVAEDAESHPSQPLVLDEAHLVLVTVTDPETGARVLLDNEPAPRAGAPDVFAVGEFFVSSSPISLHAFRPKNSAAGEVRTDHAVVRNFGEDHANVQVLFSARSETGRVVHRELRMLSLKPGNRAIVYFKWASATAGDLDLSLEVQRDGAVLTRADRTARVVPPKGYALRVSKANRVEQEGGAFFVPIAMEAGRESAAPVIANVYADGRLAGSASSTASVFEIEAEPWFGYYDVEVDFGHFQYDRRLVATVSEVQDGKLLVNGEPFIVKGVNTHSMYPNSPERCRLMMRVMRGLGFNSWRGDYPARRTVDLAYEMNTFYSVLAPFSCTPTDAIFGRQAGPSMVTARKVSELFIERYKDSAGVVLWNSCNEVGNETTDFLLSLHPVFANFDSYSRPVHYANLYGQDRWQGQDLMAINYYFGDNETPEDRQPAIARSIEIGHAHGLPVIYTECNSYRGAIHTSGAEAMRGLFEWGIERGMSGGYIYPAFNGKQHPGVLDPDFNTHKIYNEAIISAFADAEIELTDAGPDGVQLSIRNKRYFTLREASLIAFVNAQPAEAMTLHDFPPQGERAVTVPLPEKAAHLAYVIEGALEFVTHYGFQCRVPFHLAGES